MLNLKKNTNCVFLFFSFLFSIMNLYYINKLSQSTYAPLVPTAPPPKPTKKKGSWNDWFTDCTKRRFLLTYYVDKNCSCHMPWNTLLVLLSAMNLLCPCTIVAGISTSVIIIIVVMCSEYSSRLDSCTIYLVSYWYVVTYTRGAPRTFFLYENLSSAAREFSRKCETLKCENSTLAIDCRPSPFCGRS